MENMVDLWLRRPEASQNRSGHRAVSAPCRASSQGASSLAWHCAGAVDGSVCPEPVVEPAATLLHDHRPIAPFRLAARPLSRPPTAGLAAAGPHASMGQP